MSKFQKIRESIIEGDLNQIAQELNLYIQDAKVLSERNEFTLIVSQMNELIDKEAKGIILLSDFNSERNKIINKTLKFIKTRETELDFYKKRQSLQRQSSIFKSNNKIEPFVDNRDNQIYESILINGSHWMTQNLRFKHPEANSKPHNNLNRYGRLYTWNQALESCPEGWKLPNTEDWESLLNYYGGFKNHVTGSSSSTSYANLIEEGESGLNLPFGGYSNGKKVNEFGKTGYYWSENSYSYNNAFSFSISKIDNEISKNITSKMKRLSIRCIKIQ